MVVVAVLLLLLLLVVVVVVLFVVVVVLLLLLLVYLGILGLCLIGVNDTVHVLLRRLTIHPRQTVGDQKGREGVQVAVGGVPVVGLENVLGPDTALHEAHRQAGDGGWCTQVRSYAGTQGVNVRRATGNVRRAGPLRGRIRAFEKQAIYNKKYIGPQICNYWASNRTPQHSTLTWAQ